MDLFIPHWGLFHDLLKPCVILRTDSLGRYYNYNQSKLSQLVKILITYKVLFYAYVNIWWAQIEWVRQCQYMKKEIAKTCESDHCGNQAE